MVPNTPLHFAVLAYISPCALHEHPQDKPRSACPGKESSPKRQIVFFGLTFATLRRFPRGFLGGRAYLHPPPASAMAAPPQWLANLKYDAFIGTLLVLRFATSYQSSSPLFLFGRADRTPCLPPVFSTPPVSPG